MLNVVMVKQYIDIFVDKGSAVIADNLIGNAKSTNYVLTDEICNCWTGSFLQQDRLNAFCEILCSH